MSRFAALPALLLLTAMLLATAGCGSTGSEPAGPAHSAAPANGRAMGGQAGIAGGTVKMWRVNTDGTAATNILTQAVTTDANGYFTLTGFYSCITAPTTANSEIYLTITGGNPGFGSNSALALMAALGPCGSLTSSTFVIVNEVTTVASVWALQQFMGATYGVAGSEDVAVNTLAQSITGMQNAFATVPVLVTNSMGAAVSGMANATIETTKINTIANILSTCVNSDGAGICADFFAAVTPTGSTAPADTTQAALYMALNPTNNIAQIYGYMTGIGAPFSPSMSSAPYDWTLGVIYATGGSVATPVLPYLMAADASGNLWMGDSAGSSANGLMEIGPTGQSALGSPFLSGSSTPVSGPQTVAVDTLGNIWLANHGSSKNDLISFPGTGSSYTTHTAAASCLPETMALDGSNNAYFACSGMANLFEFPYSGGSYAASATQYQAVGSTPYGIAIDATGNVWVANNGSNSISEFPAGFTTATIPTTYALGFSPFGIAVDHAGNIWASGSSNVAALAKSGATYTVNVFSGGGLNSARYLAVDGSGNLWIANSGLSTISGVNYISISEFNNNGVAITADNAGSIPGGFSIPLDASFGTPAVRSVAVDPSGNVWGAGCGLSTSCNTGATSFVMELVGAATPVVTPIATALANNYIGCCSFTPAAPGGTVPTAPGYITLQASTYSPMQDSGTLSFLVTRTGGSSGAVGVSYATSNGTATGGNNTCSGVDYTSKSGTLSWSAGDTSVRTIAVPWCKTTNYTGSKTFTVTLSSPTGGATISPTASTLVSVANQVTSAIAGAGTYPFFASLATPFYLTPPSTYFNMSPWDLALPQDIYGGVGGVNGIQFSYAPVYTLTGFSDPFFYLNASNQLVFTAPANGAVSSPGVGTDDTRSEFRELYTGPGADGNSDWYGDTNSGTGGVLTGNCAVTAVSINSDEATFAQIHGQSNPFVLLVYRPAYNDVEIQISSTSAATSTPRTELATNVSLGDTLSYSLSYSAPSLTAAGTITVQVNDVTTNTTNSQQTFTIDSSWSNQGMYFKLGAYGGPTNFGNPNSDYKQVIYNSWQVCHASSCIVSH